MYLYKLYTTNINLSASLNGAAKPTPTNYFRREERNKRFAVRWLNTQAKEETTRERPMHTIWVSSVNSVLRLYLPSRLPIIFTRATVLYFFWIQERPNQQIAWRNWWFIKTVLALEEIKKCVTINSSKRYYSVRST